MFAAERAPSLRLYLITESEVNACAGSGDSNGRIGWNERLMVITLIKHADNPKWETGRKE